MVFKKGIVSPLAPKGCTNKPKMKGPNGSFDLFSSVILCFSTIFSASRLTCQLKVNDSLGSLFSN